MSAREGQLVSYLHTHHDMCLDEIDQGQAFLGYAQATLFAVPNDVPIGIGCGVVAYMSANAFPGGKPLSYLLLNGPVGGYTEGEGSIARLVQPVL